MIRTLLAAAALAALPGLAGAVDCEVDPYDAYQTALARGWSFQCNVAVAVPGAVTQNTVWADVVTRRVGCRFVTGPVPWMAPPQTGMRFFGLGIRRNLRNGWNIHSFELAGGQYTNGGGGVPMSASFRLPQAGQTYFFRISRLVFTKDGGVCANAIAEAF